MSRFRTKSVLAAIASLWLWAGATPSRGALITDLTVNVTQAPSGLYTYAYTLADESASTIGAAQLFLAVSPAANLSAVSAPTGWDVLYSAGGPDISFLSSDSSFDIAPGTAGLFSLTSAVAPALAGDRVRGFDDSAGTFAENPGTIPTPASVPEPSGLVLGVLAAACAAVSGWARRRPSA
jgi:hypothetical protein